MILCERQSMFLFPVGHLGTFEFETNNMTLDVKQNISAGRLDVSIAEGIITGTAGATFQDRNTDVGSNILCTFYGDTALSDVPITRLEAMKAYKNLSQHALGSRAIVEFTISPLTEYCGGLATKLLNEIPTHTTERLSEIAVEIEDTVQDTQELFELESSKMYAKELGLHVDSFLKKLKEFQSNWTRNLTTILPKVKSRK